MYHFFRRNQKFVMVVMVILMVAFIIPTFFRAGGGSESVVGQIGKQKVTSEQVREAQNELSLLTQRVAVRQYDRQGQQQWVPITAVVLPPFFIEQMRDNQNVEAYYLLQAEARQMGLAPSIDRVNEELSSPQVGVRMPDGSYVSLDRAEQVDEVLANKIRYSAANLLMVAEAFGRAYDAVKISEPFEKYIVSQQLQQVKERLVDFSADDYLSQVGQPTDQQLQEQFEKFGDFEANAAPVEKDPFGFGYKYPNRVKLQYIGVPRDQVRKTVMAGKSDYDWEVEANRYYLRHQNEFLAPASQPATQPGSATRPSQPIASAKPTTRPFDQVRQQCLDAVIDPLVDKLQHQIQSELRATLVTGYRTYEQSKGTPATQSAAASSATTPTTAPAGPAPYDSFEFLRQLASDIQQRYNVTLTVASVGDSFKTAKDLRELPGIGRVSQFPDEATNKVQAFQPGGHSSAPDVLSLYEPSTAIATQGDPNETGDIGDVYFYRITAAEPAHKPSSIEPIKDQLTQDWRKIQAYELAKAEAQKFLEAVQKDGFDSAASSAGKKIITTEPFTINAQFPVEGYDMSSRARQNFMHSAAEMVATLAQDKNKQHVAPPTKLVGMPADGKVAVAQLISVQISSSPYPVELTMYQVMGQFKQLMQYDWFNYDSLVARLGYQDLSGRNKQAPGQPSPSDQGRPLL